MSDIFFSKDHEWIKIDGTTGTIGISDHAAHELGDVTFVELPAVGKKVKQADVVAAIESVKAASDIYAPMSGTVTTVNSLLDTEPEQVNASPEEQAWIATMDLTDLSEAGKLMTREQYLDYLKTL